jgi:carbohydrate kinase (thermoresistant glucokinase family)
MRAGIPLTDDDRLPWLAAIAAHIDDARATNKPVVIPARRQAPLSGNPRRARDPMALVYLKGDYDTIEKRLRALTTTAVSPLKSQFEALSRNGADEHAIVLDIRRSPEETRGRS